MGGGGGVKEGCYFYIFIQLTLIKTDACILYPTNNLPAACGRVIK